MTPCLRPEEFIDAVDGVLAPARRAHVEVCATCQRTLADVGRAWIEARADDVPEPSPLFWPAVNARVHAAIRDEARAAPAMGAAWTWRRWAAVVPLAGLATLVVALVSALGRPGSPPAPGLDVAFDITAESGTEPDGDPALALVVDLASAFDDDDEPLGLQPLPDLGDVAAATLSAEEQDALRALLRSAVERPPS